MFEHLYMRNSHAGFSSSERLGLFLCPYRFFSRPIIARLRVCRQGGLRASKACSRCRYMCLSLVGCQMGLMVSDACFFLLPPNPSTASSLPP